MILFAHGLEGTPTGSKPAALTAAGFDVVAPDGRGLPLAERIAGLEAASRGRTGIVLVGSSYGGLAALMLAIRHPERLRGLVLLAPALLDLPEIGAPPETLVVPPGIPCTVLHGIRDDVVPLAASEALVARSGPHVTLRVLDDDHPLRGSLDVLVDVVRRHARGA